ncbi:hypothetical protein IFR05_017525, partial [Cadophora sp. M221]
GGAGCWTECVQLAGELGLSCGNCHYGSEGARCSLRAAAAPAGPRAGRAGRTGSSTGRTRGRRNAQVAPGAPS